MIGQQQVYDRLAELGVDFEYHEHPPIPTMEEAVRYKWWMGAAFCKNLFFRNHKGNRHYLVVAAHDTQFDVHALERRLRQGKLSFASAERMRRHLGLEPGSVSPFGLVNDAGRHVTVFFDPALRQAARLSFHPNDNRATLVLAARDFWRYVAAAGNRWCFWDDPALEEVVAAPEP